MKSTANLTGIITKINKTVNLSDGCKIRNIVICCQLENKNNTLVFHDVILWNGLTDIELKKNNVINVDGELKYKIKDGNKYAEIVAKNLKVIK